MTVAMHVVRPVRGNRRRPALPASSTPAASYPPGYFTELIARHNWPPNFQPSLTLDAGGKLTRLAVAERARQTEQGIGWGAGTVALPNTPKGLPPGWMSRFRL